ncbi:hypothetical protein ADIS_2116 [Lunatimonas lonarensis]|uniref:Uncharacterized protein n=1 Tax=Lunatimonas lonarensis TaxID=1232681 RepID=R7ZTJ5_9BACT|nr:hypothetical protein ADIS_2116 [Lunatimonas lonarensis]
MCKGWVYGNKVVSSESYFINLNKPNFVFPIFIFTSSKKHNTYYKQNTFHIQTCI